METCSEVSVQAAEIGFLNRPTSGNMSARRTCCRKIPSRSSSRGAECVSSDSSHFNAEYTRYARREYTKRHEKSDRGDGK
jgi:hypothetical protein